MGQSETRVRIREWWPAYFCRKSDSRRGEFISEAFFGRQWLKDRSCSRLHKERRMRKPDYVPSAGRACVDSRELINQSFVLMSGANVAWASQRAQIAKTRKVIRKSRQQIARLRAKTFARETA
ncbi:MAG: hypothetical protein WAL02_18585 [Rhodoplanes sp.]